MIQWDFVGPRLAGPSCAYVDVYEHLGDAVWRNRYYGAPIWVSQMDEQLLQIAITNLQKKVPRHCGRPTQIRPPYHVLPYLLRELERKQARRERAQHI